MIPKPADIGTFDIQRIHNDFGTKGVPNALSCLEIFVEGYSHF